MHTTTKPRPVGRLVDIGQLLCPGCHNPVRPEPPTAVPVFVPGLGGEFSHRDGSPLCADRLGRAVEPIEANR